MDTRLLRSFLTVARFSSFTDAALELGFTQSTVTGHVQNLERQLRVKLLDRLPTGVQVTETGSRLVPLAEEILVTTERVKTIRGGGAEEPAGTVRIMAPESLCAYRLPAVISALRDTAPQVDIWPTSGGVVQAMDSVRRGKTDLALTMEPQLPASELAAERLGEEPLILVTASDRTEPAPLTWDDLARRDALLIAEGCGYSDDVAAQLDSTGQPLGRRSQFGTIEAVKRCVAVGLGWAAVPAVTAADQIDAGDLAILNGPALPACDVHALTHPRRHLGSAVSVVLAKLRESWN